MYEACVYMFMYVCTGVLTAFYTYLVLVYSHNPHPCPCPVSPFAPSSSLSPHLSPHFHMCSGTLPTLTSLQSLFPTPEGPF